MDAIDDALRVIASLNDSGVDYVVVGGVALNLHGLIRATEDLDIFVRPNPENIARLRQALKSVWDDPHIEQITADDLCGDYPTVRYGPPHGTLYLDILTRLGKPQLSLTSTSKSKTSRGLKFASPRRAHSTE